VFYIGFAVLVNELGEIFLAAFGHSILRKARGPAAPVREQQKQNPNQLNCEKNEKLFYCRIGRKSHAT